MNAPVVVLVAGRTYDRQIDFLPVLGDRERGDLRRRQVELDGGLQTNEHRTSVARRHFFHRLPAAGIELFQERANAMINGQVGSGVNGLHGDSSFRWLCVLSPEHAMSRKCDVSNTQRGGPGTRRNSSHIVAHSIVHFPYRARRVDVRLAVELKSPTARDGGPNRYQRWWTCGRACWS